MQKNISAKKRKQGQVARIVVGVLASLIVAGLGYALLWLQPMTATEPSLGALHNCQNVTVSDSSDLISFLPGTSAKVGLIFYQGALVDPRAYAFYMCAFAEKGYATFLVKMPYNIAFLGMDSAQMVIDAHPGITTWAIGGHSLGGVSASAFAASHQKIKGLLLYGSYPASDLSQQLKDKVVCSIYGTHDGLATPAKIAQSKALLPATTQFVPIEGSIHSFFGDYGLQSGDGQPGISREQARQQIIAASLNFLSQL